MRVLSVFDCYMDTSKNTLRTRRHGAANNTFYIRSQYCICWVAFTTEYPNRYQLKLSCYQQYLVWRWLREIMKKNVFVKTFFHTFNLEFRSYAINCSVINRYKPYVDRSNSADEFNEQTLDMYKYLGMVVQQYKTGRIQTRLIV